MKSLFSYKLNKYINNFNNSIFRDLNTLIHIFPYMCLAIVIKKAKVLYLIMRNENGFRILEVDIC